MSYAEFLTQKKIVVEPVGVDVPAERIARPLYDFQRDIVRWALRRGRAAAFLDCGLGKTLIQLEWARHVLAQTGEPVLIVAPLSVADQTIREAYDKLGVPVLYVRNPDQLETGLSITNYEMLREFTGADLGGIVLDESSILKSVDGKTRTLLLERFTGIPYRLCCTATPCPNDVAELANHAEFLGAMTRVEMLASFFVHDEDGWRLRGHAERPFYRWLTSWAMAMKGPADLGYDGSRFVLPPLRIHDEIVETEWRRPGELFPGRLKGITDRAQVRRDTITERVERAAGIANRAKGQVIVWCGFNEESHAATKAIDGAMEVRGSQPPEDKCRIIEAFKAGEIRVLVSKVSIAGFGMNFQNAATMIFLGLGDSYEAYYQAIRRCWRYGQTEAVNVHVVVTDHEREIVENVRRKETEAEELSREIVNAAKEFEMEELGTKGRESEQVGRAEYEGDGWRIVQGDCVEEMGRMDDESIDFSVYSPPFLALYTYSATERDLGNSKDDDDFFQHYRYVIEGLLRITKPGRLTAVHCSQVATTKVTHGVIGLKDFRGLLVENYVKAGWIYHGEVAIDKDPQAQAIRTHAKGLLFTQLKKDSSWLRPGLADYILVFRKPGENAVPVKPDISNDDWINWARPVWYGIRESETLNTAEARERDDDRHVCPLQLGTIHRCVRLWSNPGELVFSPFAGIGSEGYEALRLGRRFLGIELKELYAKTAARNCERALADKKQGSLFGRKGAVG